MNSVFQIFDLQVYKNMFVVCDSRLGLVLIPEIVPPSSSSNMLHPQHSVSFVWRNEFPGKLSAVLMPNIFGFTNGSVIVDKMTYKGKSGCKQL